MKYSSLSLNVHWGHLQDHNLWSNRKQASPSTWPAPFHRHLIKGKDGLTEVQLEGKCHLFDTERQRCQEETGHYALIPGQQSKITFVAMFFQETTGDVIQIKCDFLLCKVSYIRQRTQTGRRRWYLHGLVDDPGFLQQVLGDLRPHHRPSNGELHLQVFAEAAGVVVDGGACVSKSLHQAVDQQDLLLERPVIGLKKTLNHKHLFGFQKVFIMTLFSILIWDFKNSEISTWRINNNDL